MDPLTLGLVGSQLGGAGLGALGSYLSSQQQQKAANKAAGTMQGYYDIATGYQQPYLSVGQMGLNQMQQGNYGTAVPQYQQGEIPGPYQSQQFNYQEDPGMAYRMQTGQQAIEQSAAGSGTGLSGATLKALAKFGQNLGSQEYGNSYNRYMQNRQQGLGEYQTNLGRAQDIRNQGWGAAKDIYGMGNEQQQQRYGQAQNLANIGQTAANNLGTMALGQGQNLASLYGQRGNAQAAGTMGMVQAGGNAMSNLGQFGMLNYLNKNK